MSCKKKKKKKKKEEETANKQCLLDIPHKDQNVMDGRTWNSISPPPSLPLLNTVCGGINGSKFFPLDSFSEVAKQTGSYKSCLPCNMALFSVYQVP